MAGGKVTVEACVSTSPGILLAPAQLPMWLVGQAGGRVAGLPFGFDLVSSELLRAGFG